MRIEPGRDVAFDISDPSSPVPLGTPSELIGGLAPPGGHSYSWVVGKGFRACFGYGIKKPGPCQGSVRLHFLDKYRLTTQAVKAIAPKKEH